MTFDQNGQPIEDAEIVEERPRAPQARAATFYPYAAPQLGELIEDAVDDAAADLDQLFTLAVLGVAAWYLVPRVLDSLRKGR